MHIYCLKSTDFTSSEQNASLLAFIFCFVTVAISTTASVPELCTSIGLLVIIPAYDIISAGALVQAEVTAGI